jgi:hypothetical protein
MNILCLFGGVPMCHGAGGLTGQHLFGARGGCSVVILGLGKVCVAVIFGHYIEDILSGFPNALLGVILFFAGACWHGGCIRFGISSSSCTAAFAAKHTPPRVLANTARGRRRRARVHRCAEEGELHCTCDGRR